jgi:hypothetical protein
MMKSPSAALLVLSRRTRDSFGDAAATKGLIGRSHQLVDSATDSEHPTIPALVHCSAPYPLCEFLLSQFNRIVTLVSCRFGQEMDGIACEIGAQRLVSWVYGWPLSRQSDAVRVRIMLRM